MASGSRRLVGRRQRYTRVCILSETHRVPRPAEGSGVAEARSHQRKRPDPRTDDLPGEVYPGGLPLFSQRCVAHRLSEQPERRQVLGRAPGDEAGPVAVASEAHRQGPEVAVECMQELQRQPGEIRTGRHRKRSGGTGADDGPRPVCRCRSWRSCSSPKSDARPPASPSAGAAPS